MNYYRGSLEDFNSWHKDAKEANGISDDGIIGKSNGRYEPSNQRTLAYSEAVQNPQDKNDYIWCYGNYIDEKFIKVTYEEAKFAGWFNTED